MRRFTFISVLLFTASHAIAQLAPNAPSDRPQSLLDAQTAAFKAAIAPYVARAKETYPAAKERFVQGLPHGETFFVTTRLRDAKGHWEQAFVRVSEIRGTTVSGLIANDLYVVEGFRRGQPYSVAESEILDWLIAKPDGTEEGNVVGKFVDNYRP